MPYHSQKRSLSRRSLTGIVVLGSLEVERFNLVLVVSGDDLSELNDHVDESSFGFVSGAVGISLVVEGALKLGHRLRIRSELIEEESFDFSDI